MVVDVVSPGWMPWRHSALAQDVPGFFLQVAAIDRVPFEVLVGGYVTRLGTHADARTQLQFMNDVKTAAADALQTTEFGAESSAEDKAKCRPDRERHFALSRAASRCFHSNSHQKNQMQAKRLI